MRKHLLTFSLILVIILQICFPLYNVWSQEQILKHGQLIKFKIEPVDPYDAFRGRYVTINVESPSLKVPLNEDFSANQPIFVLLENDSSGITDMIGVTQNADTEALKMRIDEWSIDSDGEIYFRFPLNRYYLDENKAPIADKISRNFNKKNALISARVSQSGAIIIEQLYVENKPIEDYINELK